MAAPDWDDLDDFLDTDDFAVLATITPKVGRVRLVSGIYDDQYMGATAGEYAADSSKPRFNCKLVDVLGLKRGDKIVIPGEGTFSVLNEPEADGTGMANLELARDAGA